MACVRCPEPLGEDEARTNPLGPGMMHDDCRTALLHEDHRCIDCADPLHECETMPVCGPCSRDYAA